MAGLAKRKLILVRHSAPKIVPGMPASLWQLSDEGRCRCGVLAERLAAYAPAVVVTSTEPKAIETGRIVAGILSIPFKTAPDLHEHERHNAGLFDTREQFEAQIARLYENPGQLVFGNETAGEAHSRFARAVTSIIEQHPAGSLVVVAHGTVMTLFVTHAAGLDPLPFWKRLGLPAFVVLSLPELSLLEVVESLVGDT